MKVFLITGLLLTGALALADEAKPAHKKVIDVGNLEIKGEIRRPFIQYLDTDRANAAALPGVADSALKDYEASLLKPAAIPAPAARPAKAHVKAEGKANANH